MLTANKKGCADDLKHLVYSEIMQNKSYDMPSDINTNLMTCLLILKITFTITFSPNEWISCLACFTLHKTITYLLRFIVRFRYEPIIYFEYIQKITFFN